MIPAIKSIIEFDTHGFMNCFSTGFHALMHNDIFFQQSFVFQEWMCSRYPKSVVADNSFIQRDFVFTPFLSTRNSSELN